MYLLEQWHKEVHGNILTIPLIFYDTWINEYLFKTSAK